MKEKNKSSKASRQCTKKKISSVGQERKTELFWTSTTGRDVKY